MNPAPNLVLVGPMGAGKTSIGKRLARTLRLHFVDADQAIEQRTGANVATIFDCEGEAGFRQRERAVLAELLQGEHQLLATGGGAVLAEDNRRLLRERGFVVWLQTDVASQLERLARDRSRPLLQRPNREQVLHAMAIERAPLYEDVADLRFDTSACTAADAAQRLARELAAHWQRASVAADVTAPTR